MTRIVIVHYNTPKLTEALVNSINKFVPSSEIYIFDNSDKYPFTAKFENVKVIDNTKGKYINFDKWLLGYPNRTKSPGKANSFGSAKHCYSVQKCMDLIGKDFILLDSDILLRKDISGIIDNKYLTVCSTESWGKRMRCVPYLCYINVEKCKEMGVSFYDPKRMHGLRVTPTGDSYDTGCSFYEDVVKHKMLKKINIDEYIVHYKAGSWLSSALKLNKHNTVSPDQWLHVYNSLWTGNPKEHKKIMNKKVIYTCITGGYDNIIDPVNVCEGFDYVCFTDNLGIKSNVWKLRMLPKETEGLSTVKKQRYIKINPHKVLGNYDMSIWVDGNVKIVGDMNELISSYKCDDNIITIPQHPSRNCIYSEMKACGALRKDKPEIMKPQIEKYRKEGYPENHGLVQSNIIVRKHNDPKCIKIMETWWNELKTQSHRDQLSFNYALWKNDDFKVNLMDKKIYKSKYFQVSFTHNKVIRVVSKEEKPTTFHEITGTTNVKVKPKKPVIMNAKPSNGKIRAKRPMFW